MITPTDPQTRMHEFNRVVKSLTEGVHTPSHICFLYYRRNTPPSFWSLDNVDVILKQGKSPHTAGKIMTLWADDPNVDTGNMLTWLQGNAHPAIKKMAEQGTVVNLTDMILAIAKSDEAIMNHPEVATHICYLAYRLADVTTVKHFVPVLLQIKQAFADIQQ